MKSNLKTSLVIFLIVSLFLVLFLSSFAAATPTQAKYNIYFVSVSPGVDPFLAVVYTGVQAADDLFPVEVNFVGLTVEELNPRAMVDKLEIARAAKPDGIITSFWWVEAQDEVCRKAIEEGIPIMAFNNEDTRQKNERIPYLGFVGMDELVTGEVLAKATLEKIDIKRTLIGIQVPGATSMETRASGIAKVLEKEGIPYEKIDTTMEPATVITNLGAYLIKYPETNHMFLLGPANAHPALTLLKERGLEGKVIISTIDVSEKIVEGIEEGNILMTISQQPFAQSFIAIEQLYLYLEYGILPPERTATGPVIIDKTNVEIIKKQIEMTGGG